MLYILRHVISILLLPFTVTVVVPIWLLKSETERIPGPQSGWIRVLVIVAGVAAIMIGLTLFISTVLGFAIKGRGTLAPWDPPRELVIVGVYRYVRNPMISGVLFLLLAESLFTGSPRVLIWFIVFLLINIVYIPLFEETQLEARFGERYKLYKKHVPRWVPRLTPWNPPKESQ